MKRTSMLLVAGLLLIAGCGDDDEPGASKPASPNEEAATKKEDAAPKRDKARAVSAKGTTITLGDSEFGTMLFGSNSQAIYIFENDRKGETVCYDECAEAWPPVFTEGKPKAGEGVKGSLLGTVERRDGKLQVTYAGKPLYFYAHEGPGEVRCHNVDLNGGFWWVVGPDGKRRP
jgi:predicted lipoprotein with Yx(FWY)xxD motif